MPVMNKGFDSSDARLQCDFIKGQHLGSSYYRNNQACDNVTGLQEKSRLTLCDYEKGKAIFDFFFLNDGNMAISKQKTLIQYIMSKTFT